MMRESKKGFTVHKDTFTALKHFLGFSLMGNSKDQILPMVVRYSPYKKRTTPHPKPSLNTLRPTPYRKLATRNHNRNTHRNQSTVPNNSRNTFLRQYLKRKTELKEFLPPNNIRVHAL